MSNIVSYVSTASLGGLYYDAKSESLVPMIAVDEPFLR
jgi:hypothetical protein